MKSTYRSRFLRAFRTSAMVFLRELRRQPTTMWLSPTEVEKCRTSQDDPYTYTLRSRIRILTQAIRDMEQRSLTPPGYGHDSYVSWLFTIYPELNGANLKAWHKKLADLRKELGWVMEDLPREAV